MGGLVGEEEKLVVFYFCHSLCQRLCNVGGNNYLVGHRIMNLFAKLQKFSFLMSIFEA